MIISIEKQQYWAALVDYDLKDSSWEDALLRIKDGEDLSMILSQLKGDDRDLFKALAEKHGLRVTEKTIMMICK